MRLITIAILAFILVMGTGITWNFVPALGIQTHPSGSSPSSLNIPPYPSTNLANTSAGPTGGIVLSNQQWSSYAKVAWSFFSPGVGVSPSTGLIYASPYWHEFTDWDLAGYIQAVLAAQKLGLISATGPWGADYRLSLVLNFLDTRSLNQNGIWYQFYDSDTGTVSTDGIATQGGIADGGPMLIALYDTMQEYPQFTSQVKEAVNRVNYPLLASQGFGSDLYSQYAKLGFDLWGLSTEGSDLTSIPNGSMAVAEPAMLAILEHASNSFFNQAGRQIYDAQYSAYYRTGELFALSEGQYPPYLNSSTPYVYESIEIPSGNSYSVVTWQGQVVTSSPENFVKIGFAFLAIYKSSYGLLLVNNLGKLATSDGYSEGLLSTTGQVFGAVSDNTNIMVMEACAYAVTGS
jgi:Protein of unknown function (DUF3131)